MALHFGKYNPMKAPSAFNNKNNGDKSKSHYWAPFSLFLFWMPHLINAVFHLRLSLSSTTPGQKWTDSFTVCRSEGSTTSIFGALFSLFVISGAWGYYGDEHTEEQAQIWTISGYSPLIITSSLSEIPLVPSEDQKTEGGWH